MDRDNPDGDLLDLKPNGSIRISLGSTSYSWRRPTFGEYRKFREALIGIGDEEARARDEIHAAAVTAHEEKTGKKVPEGEMPPYSDMDRLRLQLVGASLVGEWVLDIWRVLSTKEPPAVDELPQWMTTSEFSTQLFQHWRSLPLRSSAQG